MTLSTIIANRLDLYNSAKDEGENCYDDSDVDAGSYRYNAATTDDISVYVTYKGAVWLCNDSGHVAL